MAAGSLINFSLKKAGMPVGRVTFLHIYPLSFDEYLIANNQQYLLDYKNQHHVESPLHEKLLTELKHYLWLGGMPAVVDAWLKFQDIQSCQHLQDSILQAYRNDFPKYAKSHQINRVDKVFSQLCQKVGNKFTYRQVDQTERAAVLKEALFLLKEAGIAYLAHHTAVQGLPLGATINEKKFKVFFFDVGLMQRMLGLNLHAWLNESISVSHMGAICEQFVAQEYLAYLPNHIQSSLYYWHREQRTSNAEIDFVFVVNDKILPVEVKSGAKGRLKILHLFLETHPQCAQGLKISEQLEGSPTDLIRSVPLYKISSFF